MAAVKQNFHSIVLARVDNNCYYLLLVLVISNCAFFTLIIIDIPVRDTTIKTIRTIDHPGYGLFVIGKKSIFSGH